jgi:hypothetical protein
MGYGLDDLEIGIRFPAGASHFFLHGVQTGFWDQPNVLASVPVALSVGCGSSVKLIFSLVHC